MTTTETRDLSVFADKKVTLVYRDDEDKEQTKEGTVQAASAIGLVFKEKGKSDVDIVRAEQVVNIEAAPEKEPNVQIKKLQPVTKNYRQHLADRHGYAPDDLNKLTEEQGKEIHDGIDHSKLAHRHEVPKAQQDAQAGAADDAPIGDVSDVEGAEPEPESDDDDA